MYFFFPLLVSSLNKYNACMVGIVLLAIYQAGAVLALQALLTNNKPIKLAKNYLLFDKFLLRIRRQLFPNMN